MAELSKIRKNGVDYDIKDAVARKAIEDLKIPEGGNSAQPDWNADEGESGHILNKPEGVGYIEMEVLYDGELSYSDTVYHAPGFLAEDGETYTITWNGTPYICTAKTIVADGVLAIVLGNVGVFVPEEEQTGEPFVYSWDETSGPLWFSFDENGNEINDANRLPTAKIEHHKTVKIPSQYLPEVVTDEQIASAVEDYMAEHPVTGGAESSIFAGKTASFYGDSLTEENWHYTKGYHQWIKELLGLASYNNYGVSGYKVSDVYNKVNSVTDTADIIFVMCGVNDVQSDVPLGALAELKSDTVYGNLNLLCSKLREKYPTKLLVFITPHEQTNYPSSIGVSMYDVAKAVKEVCEKHSIVVYDNFVVSGICKANLSTFTTDNCHWNDTAHEMVGKNLAKFMVNTFGYLYGSTTGGDTHNHNYTGTVTTAATCTTAGVKTFTCSCGESYTEIIPATGHNYVDGVCSACGDVDPNYGGEDDSAGFVGKTMRVTRYHNGIFDLTAIVGVDDDAKLGNTVEFRVTGADCENLTTHTAVWMQVFGDATGVCGNGKYSGFLSDGTEVTSTVSDSGELDSVATYSINAAPTTEYMKVCIPVAPADATKPAQFTIGQISVTVNGIEKPIIAIGGFFTDETCEII